MNILEDVTSIHLFLSYASLHGVVDHGSPQLQRTTKFNWKPKTKNANRNKYLDPDREEKNTECSVA